MDGGRGRGHADKRSRDKTGGKYYRADSADTMRQIYAEIDRLEKTEVEVKKYEHYDELYGRWRWPGWPCSCWKWF